MGTGKTMAQVDRPTTTNIESATEQSGGDADEEMTKLSKDNLFHVLQNERRRRVLEYMIDRGHGRYEMRDIAEQVAAWEHDTTVRQLTSDERQRVYIALYQSHLPKLDDLGLIDYNQKRGIVEETPLINQTATHLDVIDEEDDEEPEGTRTPMLPVAAAGVAAGGLSATILGFVANVSPVIVASLVMLLSALMTWPVVARGSSTDE